VPVDFAESSEDIKDETADLSDPVQPDMNDDDDNEQVFGDDEVVAAMEPETFLEEDTSPQQQQHEEMMEIAQEENGDDGDSDEKEVGSSNEATAVPSEFVIRDPSTPATETDMKEEDTNNEEADITA